MLISTLVELNHELLRREVDVTALRLRLLLILVLESARPVRVLVHLLDVDASAHLASTVV